MPFDYIAHKRKMLAHCLWMAEMGHVEYAKATAAQYERDSFGALEGLHAKVLETLKKQPPATPPGATHESV